MRALDETLDSDGRQYRSASVDCEARAVQCRHTTVPPWLDDCAQEHSSVVSRITSDAGTRSGCHTSSHVAVLLYRSLAVGTHALQEKGERTIAQPLRLYSLLSTDVQVCNALSTKIRHHGLVSTATPWSWCEPAARPVPLRMSIRATVSNFHKGSMLHWPKHIRRPISSSKALKCMPFLFLLVIIPRRGMDKHCGHKASFSRSGATPCACSMTSMRISIFVLQYPEPHLSQSHKHCTLG